MRALRLVRALVLLAAGTAAAQVSFYHAPRYLLGGVGSTSTLYWNGLWLADLTRKTTTLVHLTPRRKLYYFRSAMMDYDNRHIVVAVQGTTSSFYANYLRSGLYRIDPTTFQITTIRMDTVNLYRPYHMLLNQDGDYIVASGKSTPFWSYALFKVTRTGRLTTLLDTHRLGVRGWMYYDLGIDMDTGNYLVPVAGHLVTSLGTFWNPVFVVAEDGSFTTFSGPGTAGSWPYESLNQNFDHGAIEWQTLGFLFHLRRGGSYVTLFNYGWVGGNWSMGLAGLFDLQTAPTKRLVGDAREQRRTTNLYRYLPGIYYASRAVPLARMVPLDPQNKLGFRYYTSYAFAFYRGRHIQTVRVGRRKWEIRLSCPRFPGSRYILLLSMSGYRPPVRLRDGRRIYLKPDILTFLSAARRLRPFFDPGRGHLDARGEARGLLDLTHLPPQGAPLYIAVILADRRGRVLYLPDTYVMRI